MTSIGRIPAETSRALAGELVLRAEEYRAVRAAVSTSGSLLDENHPMMAQLGQRNAERLNAIMDAFGWPGRKVIGAADWAPELLLQHAIGSPKVMRRGLGLVRAAERRGEIDPVYVAVLEDRILTLEGKQQQYGTQFDWDDRGEPNTLPIAYVEDVDVRRCAAGLDALAEDVERVRAEARRYGERPPPDLPSRREAFDTWARAVGWRD